MFNAEVAVATYSEAMEESREVVRRTLLIAALKGGAAGVAVGVSSALIMWAALTCQRDAWDCLFVGLGAMAGALLLAPVLSWAVLRLLRVERSLPVAVGGTLASLFLLMVVPAGFLTPILAVPFLLVMTVTGYGGSAVALSRWTPLWLRWMYVIGLALFLAVVFVLVLALLEVV